MNPQFVKLMMMTTSTHDAEALVAIRKANAMLASANMNWEEYLGGPKEYRTASNPPWEEPPPKKASSRTNTDEDIDRMFEAAFANCRKGSSFYATLESIHEWWEKKHFLTPRQYEVVQKAAR